MSSIMKGYDRKDTTNGDETGLFFHVLTNKTHERCVGGKL
jgi:hypothetical protein